MTTTEMTVEELAPRTEDEVRERLAAGKLVEGLAHMSPAYLRGIRRILTVSADTELISAPAYLRAAQHAPALNNYGSAMSIIQDELAHAHIGYRLLGDLGVDTAELIYEREPVAFKYPYAFDVPLDSWYELVLANALYDQAGFVLLSDVHSCSTFGPWKRALAKVDKEETFHLRHGRTWVKKLVADPQDKRRLQASLDWMFILTLEWFGLPDAQKKHGIQLEYGFKGMTNDELRQAWMAAVVPFMEEVGLSVPAHYDEESLTYRDRLPVPGRVRRGTQAVATRRGVDHVGSGPGALAAQRADERRLRDPASEGLPNDGGEPAVSAAGPELTVAERAEARLWAALRDVEDPEIPISVVGMGLIVSLAYREHERAVAIELTFTAMGCPAMDMIQDDIRERLLREPDVDAVRIEITWDPVWTRSRIREESRETMRRLGIAV